MNIYDPADYIVYVTMDRPAAPVMPVQHRLPPGYANESPRTRLRSAAQPPGHRRGGGRRTAGAGVEADRPTPGRAVPGRW